METSNLSSRLIVAADWKPKNGFGFEQIRDEVMILAGQLKDSRVIIKVNAILRAYGYNLITELKKLGLQVFADLKLNDIPETMANDALMLHEFKPDFLTIMCSAGIDGMMAVQQAIGDTTKVLGVTALTSLDEEECQSIYGCSTKAAVLKFARAAKTAGLYGLICSPQELDMLNKHYDLTGLKFFTPGIRPLWSLVAGDDQSRVMTPAKAIQAGAAGIVVGRPIQQAKPNDKGLPQSPLEAVEAVLKEIEEAITA